MTTVKSGDSVIMRKSGTDEVTRGVIEFIDGKVYVNTHRGMVKVEDGDYVVNDEIIGSMKLMNVSRRFQRRANLYGMPLTMWAIFCMEEQERIRGNQGD